eukprot:439870-Lingulodinium_polyedra.AAC.1
MANTSQISEPHEGLNLAKYRVSGHPEAQNLAQCSVFAHPKAGEERKQQEEGGGVFIFYRYTNSRSTANAVASIICD